MTPKVKLGTCKHNFVFKATKIWNKLIGLIIPGSARNSDLRASIAFVKGKIKMYMQSANFSKLRSYLFMVMNLRYVCNLI